MGGEGTAAQTINISGTDSSEAPSGLFSEAEGAGDGGTIDLTVQNLSLLDQGRISGNTASTGQAGSLTGNVGKLDIQGGARIESSTTNQGAGGTILIQGITGENSFAGEVTIAGQDSAGNAGGLFSSASGAGSGGSIQVLADTITLDTESEVSASSTDAGNAGNINFTA